MPLSDREPAPDSVYWLGLDAIFGGVGVDPPGAGQGPDPGRDRAGSRRSASSSCSAVVVADRSSSRRSARSATTRSRRWGRRKPYIVDRGVARRRLPGRASRPRNTLHRDRGVRHPAAVQLELRAGPVPGLRPGPRAGAAGRAGERAGRADAGPRRRRPGSSARRDDPAGSRTTSRSPPIVARRHRARHDAVASSSGVGEGRPPKSRDGRLVARRSPREAWGTDILRERSYLWLVGSRLFFLMAGRVPDRPRPSLPRAGRSASTDSDERANWLLVVIGWSSRSATSSAIVPGGRLSDRIGRKPVIYASCVLGAVGMTSCAARPVLPVAVLGVDPRSASAAGTLPGGRLGADDRHHPEGVVGPVHGHQSTSRRRIGGALAGDHRRARHRHRSAASAEPRARARACDPGRRRLFARRGRPAPARVDERRREDVAGAGALPVADAAGLARPSGRGPPTASPAGRGHQRRQVAGRRKSNGSACGRATGRRPQVHEVVEPDRARPEPEQRLELDDRQRQRQRGSARPRPPARARPQRLRPRGQDRARRRPGPTSSRSPAPTAGRRAAAR